MNLIGMAAGMALEGFVPYVNTIATFLTRRCYEQVAIDICLHNLPVRMLGNGGGLVYAPLGPTHLATDDIAIMRVLPNMCVVAPSDAEEMRAFMLQTPEKIDRLKTFFRREVRNGREIERAPNAPGRMQPRRRPSGRGWSRQFKEPGFLSPRGDTRC